MGSETCLKIDGAVGVEWAVANSRLSGRRAPIKIIPHRGQDRHTDDLDKGNYTRGRTANLMSLDDDPPPADATAAFPLPYPCACRERGSSSGWPQKSFPRTTTNWQILRCVCSLWFVGTETLHCRLAESLWIFPDDPRRCYMSTQRSPCSPRTR